MSNKRSHEAISDAATVLRKSMHIVMKFIHSALREIRKKVSQFSNSAVDVTVFQQRSQHPRQGVTYVVPQVLHIACHSDRLMMKVFAPGICSAHLGFKFPIETVKLGTDNNQTAWTQNRSNQCDRDNERK